MVVKYGEILEVNEDGSVVIVVPMGKDAYIIDRQQIEECEVRFKDGRKISPSQRKYIYSLLNAIAEYTGESTGVIKETMKEGFAKQMGISPDFSLSNVDMTLANNFLDFLTEMVLENDIPTKYPISEMSGDIGRYVYGCCVRNRCCIYNKPGRLVNLSRPEQPIEVGDYILPLSKEAETELNRVGIQNFRQTRHIQPGKADSYLGSKLKLQKTA